MPPGSHIDLKAGFIYGTNFMGSIGGEIVLYSARVVASGNTSCWNFQVLSDVTVQATAEQATVLDMFYDLIERMYKKKSVVVFEVTKVIPARPGTSPAPSKDELLLRRQLLNARK